MNSQWRGSHVRMKPVTGWQLQHLLPPRISVYLAMSTSIRRICNQSFPKNPHWFNSSQLVYLVATYWTCLVFLISGVCTCLRSSPIRVELVKDSVPPSDEICETGQKRSSKHACDAITERPNLIWPCVSELVLALSFEFLQEIYLFFEREKLWRRRYALSCWRFSQFSFSRAKFKKKEESIQEASINKRRRLQHSTFPLENILNSFSTVPKRLRVSNRCWIHRDELTRRNLRNKMRRKKNPKPNVYNAQAPRWDKCVYIGGRRELRYMHNNEKKGGGGEDGHARRAGKRTRPGLSRWRDLPQSGSFPVSLSLSLVFFFLRNILLDLDLLLVHTVFTSNQRKFT